MVTEYIGQEFNSLFDHGKGYHLEGYRFHACDFTRCLLSMTNDPALRATARNIELIDCRANGCGIGPAIFENVRVSGLQTNDLLIVWGALFSNVILEGRIGKLKLNISVTHWDPTGKVQAPFDAFRHEYYKSVDWALDIRNARFREFEFRGIPARLVRRDPESQLVITRERALQPGWREMLNPDIKLWPFMIDLFLKDGDPDMVIVVPLDAPKKKRDQLLRQAQELRKVGIAEPD